MDGILDTCIHHMIQLVSFKGPMFLLLHRFSSALYTLGVLTSIPLHFYHLLLVFIFSVRKNPMYNKMEKAAMIN